MKTDFFPYGVQYYRQPTPLPDEWARDLKNIKEANYTHIQLRPQWKWGEKIEGKYEFDDIEILMDLALKNDLKVIIKPMVECAPDWIFAKYEGSRIGYMGIPIPPIAHGAFYVGGWLPCFDNPKVKEGAYNFAREIALKFKDHKALWFYNAWNEPRSRPGGQCQCAHSKENYRQWLKNKFGTIDNLNKIYGKAYTNFEFIDPPSSSTDYVEMSLWRTWATYAVSQHIKNVYEGIKSADPEKAVMCHVGCCQVITDPLDDATDDILNKESVDFYGTSFPVPLEPKTNNEIMAPQLIGNWLRRVDKEFWVQEFYPCQEEWGKPPHPDKLKRLLWQSIATGCKGWTYWQYRSERVGNESNGWAMREINGNETPRSKVCDNIGKKLCENKEFANSELVKPIVAELFHKEQNLLSRLEANKKNFITENPVGAPYLYNKALCGHHSIFSSIIKNGMDFVTWKDDFSQYKAVSVVADEIINPTMAEKLKTYVKNGGNLIVEFPFATRDENTWVSLERPNNNLEELVGIKEKIRYYENHSCNIFNLDFNNVGVYIEGEPINDNVKIIGKWDTGEPCAFMNKYGKGSVISLLANISSINDFEKEKRQLGKKIYGELGIETLNNLLIFERENKGKIIEFIFNYSNNEETVERKYTKIIDSENITINGETISLKPQSFLVLGK